MTSLAIPTAQTLAFPAARLDRLSVSQYYKMLDAKVLHYGDRVELLEGLLVRKMTHNPPHDQAVTRISRLLGKILPEQWLVRPQCSIRLKTSVPEPDIAVVRGPESRYDDRHPKSEDIELLIEVADSSLLSDRRYKKVLYAKAKIVEFWIVNLVDDRVEVYTTPRSGRHADYDKQMVYPAGTQMPVVIGGQKFESLAVERLLYSST